MQDKIGPPRGYQRGGKEPDMGGRGGDGPNLLPRYVKGRRLLEKGNAWAPNTLFVLHEVLVCCK